MDRRTIIITLLIFSLTTVGVTGANPEQPSIESRADADFGASPSNTSAEQNSTESDLSLRNQRVTEGEPGVQTNSVTEQLSVVIETKGNSSTWQAEIENAGFTVETTHKELVQGKASLQVLRSLSDEDWVKNVRRPVPPTQHTVSEGVETINASTLHAKGISGKDVKVGVIDTGFDLSHPEIADNVASYYSPTGNISPIGETTHGTAVSELVVDTAPNSSLYLTNARTEVELANAVQWLRDQDVDVISMSMGWNAQPYDGTGRVSQIATNATKDDILFVTSAGNAAQTHWEGPPTDTDADDAIEFDDGSETNFLNEGKSVSSVRVFLSWDDWEDTDQDYDLYLWRSHSSEADELVAYSNRSQLSGAQPYEAIVQQVPTGVYYVTVNRSAGQDPVTLDLYTSTPLEHKVPESSLTAPATAYNITTVGAYRYDTRSLEYYSSRGPTNDGRRGVDVTGPARVTTDTLTPFAGTSASAPHVSGAAALLLEEDSTLAWSQLESTLLTTATDSGPAGVDNSTGYGQVNAEGAFTALQGTPANLSLSYTVNTSAIAPALPLGITATITNTGDQTGNTSVDFLADGEAFHTQNITVAGNSSTQYSVSTNFTQEGLHTVTVGQQTPTEITVEPASFHTTYSVSKTSLVRNETVSVEATVTNTGNSTGVHPITFTADGSTFAQANPRLDAGDTTNITRSTSFNTSGPHNVSVAGLNSTTLSVVDAPIIGANPVTDPDGDQRYEDINGDGGFNIIDVGLFFDEYTDPDVTQNPSFFDFNSDGSVNIIDVGVLFQMV